MVSSAIAPSLLLSVASCLAWSSQFGFSAAQKLPIPAQNTSNWAQYDPFFPVEPYAPPPEGCTVTQVNLVSAKDAYVVRIHIKRDSASETWRAMAYLWGAGEAGGYCDEVAGSGAVH